MNEFLITTIIFDMHLKFSYHNFTPWQPRLLANQVRKVLQLRSKTMGYLGTVVFELLYLFSRRFPESVFSTDQARLHPGLKPPGTA